MLYKAFISVVYTYFGPHSHNSSATHARVTGSFTPGERSIMFINLTNHRFEDWSELQKREAANQFGEFTGLEGFPEVDPIFSKEDVARTVLAVLSDIDAAIHHNGLNPADVSIVCQGEMTFVVTFVRKATERGYRCYAATSERKTIETQLPDGTNTKTSVFKFVQFREY